METKAISSSAVSASTDDSSDRASQTEQRRAMSDHDVDLEDPVNSSLKNKLKDWDTKKSLLTWLLICYSVSK